MLRKWTLVLISLTSFTASALEIQGHRGSRWTHPENSIPGFEEALQAGADVLEFDLGMTQDGVLIVSHDPKLNEKICRYKNGSPLKHSVVIHKKTLKQLKEIDCGSMINPRFPLQKTVFQTEMPTFEEVLIWIKNHELAQKVELNVETKIDKASSIPTATPRQFAKELARLLQKHAMVERTVVQSFDFRSLKEIRKILPEVRISLLVWMQSWSEIKEAIATYKADIISPNYKWLNAKIVEEAKEMKVRVIPWTVNEDSDWKKMIEMGVDGIITDRPRALKKALEFNRL